MDFLDRREWRSPRPRPWRALQSPVYIRKKAAANKRERKNAKILKNNLKIQMAALGVVNPNRFRLSNAATKKAVRLVDYNYNIQIFQKKNNRYCTTYINISKSCIIRQYE